MTDSGDSRISVIPKPTHDSGTADPVRSSACVALRTVMSSREVKPTAQMARSNETKCQSIVVSKKSWSRNSQKISLSGTAVRSTLIQMYKGFLANSS